MANIDTTQIAGFDGMTAEQKVEALLGVEIPEAVDMTGYVKKSLLDAKLSELAKANDKLKEKMSADELAEAERQRVQDENDRKYSELETKYKELAEKATISEYTTKYIEQGYEASLAKSTAEALARGDMDTVFKNGEKQKETLEKKIREDLINKTPKPRGAGADDKQIDSAVEKARELAKSRYGNDKAYSDIISKYK